MKFKMPLQNYTREIFNPDGSVLESYIHCGVCMTILTGISCSYCEQKRAKKQRNLLAMLEKKRKIL